MDRFDELERGDGTRNNRFAEYIVTVDGTHGRQVQHAPSPAVAAQDARAAFDCIPGSVLIVTRCNDRTVTRWQWDGEYMRVADPVVLDAETIGEAILHILARDSASSLGALAMEIRCDETYILAALKAYAADGVVRGFAERVRLVSAPRVPRVSSQQ